jgi:uncharacterized protein
MAITPTYPGVYIQEIPSGVRTITGVATSITAFIGRAARGPNNEPTIVNNYGDFERIFGGLGVNYPLSYAVGDFFQNGGGQAIIVRLFRPTEADNAKARVAAIAVAEAATGDSATAAAEAASVIAGGFTEEPEKGAAAIVKEAAEEAADGEDSTPESVKAAAEAAIGRAAPTITARLELDGARRAATAVAQAAAQAAEANDADAASVAAAASEKAEEYQAEPAESVAKAVAEAASSAAQEEEATAESVKSAAKNAVDQAVAAATGAAQPNVLNLVAAYKGKWGNKLRARVDHDVPPNDNLPAWVEVNELEATDLFNLTVFDGSTGTVEKFVNLTVADSPRRMNRVLQNNSRLVRAEGDLPEARPDSHGKLTSANQGNLWTDDTLSSPVSTEAQDSAGLLPPDYTGSRANKTGLYALENTDLFNLLCIPPDSREGDTDPEVYSAALNYCVERRAMLIVDPPATWNETERARQGIRGEGPDEGKLTLSGLNARNAALYFPRVKKADPLRENQTDTFVPCGLVAGAMARTDVQRGVWKAPAGIDVSLNGIRGLSVPLTNDENGQLNPLGINCLRTFPVIGHVIWGSRTLRGADLLADEYKYVPVRRLALYIEESLYRGLQWVVFEPNDEPLWAQIRLNVGAFMHNLFRKGAFQGSSPSDAYLVKCDSETTTQNDINLGIVNILVGFAPLKPAEFVILKIQQLAGQVET